MSLDHAARPSTRSRKAHSFVVPRRAGRASAHLAPLRQAATAALEHLPPDQLFTPEYDFERSQRLFARVVHEFQGIPPGTSPDTIGSGLWIVLQTLHRMRAAQDRPLKSLACYGSQPLENLEARLTHQERPYARIYQGIRILLEDHSRVLTLAHELENAILGLALRDNLGLEEARFELIGKLMAVFGFPKRLATLWSSSSEVFLSHLREGRLFIDRGVPARHGQQTHLFQMVLVLWAASKDPAAFGGSSKQLPPILSAYRAMSLELFGLLMDADSFMALYRRPEELTWVGRAMPTFLGYS